MENLHELPDEAYESGDAADSRGADFEGVEFIGAGSVGAGSVGARPVGAGSVGAGLQTIALDSAFAESRYSGALADGCSSIVDEIAGLKRAEARQQAWMIERIDEARRLAEATLHGVRVLGSSLSAVQQREMAGRSLVAELACALRMPESTVIGMVSDAEALMHRLPATMNALRAGDISYRHARVMIDQTATLASDAASVLEGQALGFARTLTAAKFTAKTRVLRERLDPDSITARVAKSAKDRRLEFLPADDGMAWLNLYTTAPEATSIYGAVRDQAVAVKNPNDPRTLTQLTADVFTDAVSAALCGDLPAGGVQSDPAASPRLGSGAAFRRIRPTVTVTVPAFTLLGVSNEPATLEGYGPIDADAARALAGQSTVWYRMLTDPKTGAPIALDSTTYRPTKAMKRYLRYVDGTCRFPGCSRAARHCDLDHTKDHQHGGPTECENLSHLCRKHHRLKHQTTWNVKQLGAGSLEWTSPGGLSYITEPDVLLTAPGPPSPPDDADQAETKPPPGPPDLPTPKYDPNAAPPF
ncbi:HNH endonuclease signature motif containing protein [Mycetocola sp.]|uniref:HNH endonuclease signature motif containing protein n=1 Tax=Mycetocola sp. TaxID=1871042 RepID=UPI0026185CC9|nr:HNH endonuclease signature motif containing protein [Mycetocola sp.]MCU1560467.1 hypothetical protein [Mycetocola sp.]